MLEATVSLTSTLSVRLHLYIRTFQYFLSLSILQLNKALNVKGPGKGTQFHSESVGLGIVTEKFCD